ncbi:MAG: hypothetical protein JXX28_07525 [Deltaproteobacteria bacterium]|nr:hypothetical protein [Deltaproteobacteria bacterium]
MTATPRGGILRYRLTSERPLLSLLPLIALARTLTLGVDAPDLPAALAMAADGDEVLVPAGDWEGGGSTTRSLSLRGAPGARLVGGGPLQVEGATVVLSDLALVPAGRALEVRGGALWLERVSITGGRALTGGGCLLAEDSAVSAVDTRFGDCRAAEGLGGALLATRSALTLDRVEFIGGRATGGGAMALLDAELLGRGLTFSGQAVRGGDGGAILAEGGTLRLERSSLDGAEVDEGSGGLIALSGVEATLIDCTLTGGLARGGDGGAILSRGGALTLDGCVLTRCAAYATAPTQSAKGGAVAVTDGRYALRDTAFADNTAESWGAGLYTERASGAVERCLFQRGYAYYGGAIYLRERGDHLVRESAFRDNAASYGGALRWLSGDLTSTLEVSGSDFADNAASGYGGAMYLRTAGSLTLRDSAFTRDRADLGGALVLWSLYAVEARRNLFCASEASTRDSAAGGAAFLYAMGAGPDLWENNTFVENSAEAQGGALAFHTSPNAEVVGNTFLGGAALGGGGAVSALASPGLRFTDNLVAWTLAGDGLTSDEPVDLRWNAWWENDGAHLSEGLALPEERLEADPLIDLWTPDRDCAGDRLLPLSVSPLVDAGSPGRLDPDGSPADLGATGGPDAAPSLWADLDRDTWPALWDCDDHSASAFPGAAEVVGDGIDQDCDGQDLLDGDGDGWVAQFDCDDRDATVHPEAQEAWYDGVDQDCDGRDDDQDRDGSPVAEDCDDTDDTVHPGASELEGDGIDQDCDGQDAAPSSRCAAPLGALPWWGAVVGLGWRRRRAARTGSGAPPR